MYAGVDRLGLAGGGPGPPRTRMDTSKAMALLGFPSSRTFESTKIAEIQTAFMFRVHTLEHGLGGGRRGGGDPRAAKGKRDELRKVNEAYQFLTRKRKQLSGRSMVEVSEVA